MNAAPCIRLKHQNQPKRLDPPEPAFDFTDNFSTNHVRTNNFRTNRLRTDHYCQTRDLKVCCRDGGAVILSQDTYWCHTVSAFTAFSPNRIGEYDSHTYYCCTNCSTNWYSDCNSTWTETQ